MRKIKQYISIMLCIMLAIMEMPVAVFAESSNKQGIEVSTAEEIILLGDEEAPSYIEGESYFLTEDISISYDDLKKLDFEDFAATLSGEKSEYKEMVYDSETNTIFLHNVYQLELLKKGGEPVLSDDYDAYKIGTGKVFEIEGGLLCYDENHNYIFCSDFSLERPKTLAEEITEEGNKGTEGESGEETDKSEAGTVNEPTEEDTEKEKAEELTEEGTREEANKEPAEEDKEKEETTDGTEGEGTEDAANLNSKKLMKSGAPLRSSEPAGPYPDELNGRDYFGEVVREIGGKKYILIGDQQQLRAIGTGADVTEPIWAVYYEKKSTGILTTDWFIIDDNEDYPIYLYYPGDADLIKFDENFDWSDKELFDVNDGGHSIGSKDFLGTGLTDLDAEKRYIFYGSKVEDGKLIYDENAKTALQTTYIGSSAKYDYDANYIIFRDIFLTEDGTDDTNTVEWDPIDTFTGYMEGRLNMEPGENPTIHHVEILQDTAVEQSTYATGSHTEYGVGFFRNLVTPYDNVLSIGDKSITVKNITLNDVSVDTTTTSIHQDYSLVGALLTPLLNLLNMTSGLEKDPKSLATGAFVGVVRGRVNISGCKVTNLDHVANANNWTGGFVGYASGITRYEALSGLLGGLTELLGSVLNVVPILGLGDLVNVLVNGGALDAKYLIPIGYINAVFENNLVSYSGNEEATGNTHTGGFIGESSGSVFKNCDVEKTSSLTVSGTDYVGGFGGNTENVVIVGLLTDLGIDVLGNFPVNSAMFGCDITGQGALAVSASSTAEEQGYAGGFVGRMANSYAIDCSISGLASVSGQAFVLVCYP